MTIEPVQENNIVTAGSDRGFCIVFAIVFFAVALWPMLGGGPVRIWAAAAGAALLFFAFVRPQVLGPLNRLWFRFGILLARYLTPLVLALIFIVSVLPIALIMRALGKDLLRLRRAETAKSYWIPRPPDGTGSMRNQF